MSDQRDGGIAWCDETWNPIRGCSRVSPGCMNCYAERTASRFGGPGQPYEGLVKVRKIATAEQPYSPPQKPAWTGEVRMVPEHLADPLRWRRPRRIFVNSMSDLFHEKLANEEIAAVFGVMAAAPRHTFQVLTKRPERMVAWFEWLAERARANSETMSSSLLRQCNEGWLAGLGGLMASHEDRCSIAEAPWPLPNVWLGVTAEDQQRADERIPLLLEIPAAVRFVSVEPQLGHVDLSEYMDKCGAPCGASNETLDWVIQGAESGPGARPFDLAWARSMRDRCEEFRVAYFLKQIIVGGRKVSTPPLDGVVHAEFPS